MVACRLLHFELIKMVSGRLGVTLLLNSDRLVLDCLLVLRLQFAGNHHG